MWPGGFDVSWLQVAALVLSVCVALVGAFWALFRPLICSLIEASVVVPLAKLESEVKKTNEIHSAQIRHLELEMARTICLLEAKGCLRSSHCEVEK